MKTILSCLLVLLFLSGCTSKVTLTQLKNPKATQHKIKKLVLVPLKNDSINQLHALQAALSNHVVDAQPYFTVVIRDDLEPILKEKELNELQQSLRNDHTSLNHLQQAQAILQGEVLEASMQSRHYLKPIVDKTRCIEFNKKKECITFYKEIQRCQTNHYILQTSIKVAQIEQAKILFSNIYTKEDIFSRCNPSLGFFPSKSIHLQTLAQQIAKDFIKDIAPYYQSYEVKIIEELDIKLNKEHTQNFEQAVQWLIHENFNKAHTAFIQLNEAIAPQKSSTVLYNLGLCYEAIKQYEDALNYYQQALELKNEPSNLVLQAITRMQKQIKQEETLQTFTH